MGEDGESMSGRTNYCYFTKQKISTKQKETTYTNKNKSHTHTQCYFSTNLPQGFYPFLSVCGTHCTVLLTVKELGMMCMLKEY